MNFEFTSELLLLDEFSRTRSFGSFCVFMIFSKPIPGGNNSAVDSHISTNAFSWSLPFIHVLFFFYRLRYFCFSFQRVLLFCMYLYVRFSHEAVVTLYLTKNSSMHSTKTCTLYLK